MFQCAQRDRICGPGGADPAPESTRSTLSVAAAGEAFVAKDDWHKHTESTRDWQHHMEEWQQKVDNLLATLQESLVTSASVRNEVLAVAPQVFKDLDVADHKWKEQQESRWVTVESEMGALRERVDSQSIAPALLANTGGTGEPGSYGESSDMAANEPKSSPAAETYESAKESPRIRAQVVALEQLQARCSDIEMRLDDLTKEFKAYDKSKDVIKEMLETDNVQDSIAPIKKEVTSLNTEQKEELQRRLDKDSLDEADTGHTVEESMWEACLLMGFPCIGVEVSIVLALGAVINVAIQLLFCMIVFGNLADETLGSETIEAVKHWRGVVGHSLDLVNPVSRTTLVAQLCASDDALQLSAAQFSMYSDVRDFLIPSKREVVDLGMTWLNGRCLCNFALLLWLMSIVEDVLHNKSFLYAVFCLPRGPPAMHVTDNGWTITQFSYVQVMLVLLLSCVPRLFAAGFLGYMGIRFLAYTTNVGDLLLNAMALAFVLDVDEMIYGFLAPKRAKTVISQLEPIPTGRPYLEYLGTVFGGRLKCLRAGHFQSFGRLFVCATVVVIVDQLLVHPFSQDMEEVRRWMCDGDRDFAYTISKASGAVYYTRSQPFNDEDYGTFYSKTAVLSLTGIPDSNVSAAAWSERTAQAGLTGIAYMETSWRSLLEMHTKDASQAASFLSCQDKLYEGGPSSDYGEAFIAKTLLRALTGDSSLQSCSDVPQQLCRDYGGTEARAWCPETCGCDNAWVGLFYGTSQFGCPSECSDAFGNSMTYPPDGNSQYSPPESFLSSYPYCKDVARDILGQAPSWINWISVLLPIVVKMNYLPVLEHFLGKVMPGANASDPNHLARLGCQLVLALKRKGFETCIPNSGSISRSARPWCPGSCNCNVGNSDECPPACSCSVGNCDVLYNPEQSCDFGICRPENYGRQWYEILTVPVLPTTPQQGNAQGNAQGQGNASQGQGNAQGQQNAQGQGNAQGNNSKR